ncbi:hypothetical protein V1264_015961 [Littorina saxatilis]|uniref:C-type lectin domain-containing protein n=2 Tax=Littorina saxatilis TaxID=31220 RepID=A0AAN9BME8_9CAEN
MVYVAPANMTSAPGWQYFRLISACPVGKAYIADRVTGTCYRLVLTAKKIWVDARDACAENNEALAVLEPVDKASFIRDFFSGNKGITSNNVFIGAKRPTASVPFPPTGPDFVWLNGQAVNMTATAPFWVPGKPGPLGSNQFLRLNGDLDYGWSDAQGTWFQDYICERPFFQ